MHHCRDLLSSSLLIKKHYAAIVSAGSKEGTTGSMGNVLVVPSLLTLLTPMVGHNLEHLFCSAKKSYVASYVMKSCGRNKCVHQDSVGSHHQIQIIWGEQRRWKAHRRNGAKILKKSYDFAPMWIWTHNLGDMTQTLYHCATEVKGEPPENQI